MGDNCLNQGLSLKIVLIIGFGTVRERLVTKDCFDYRLLNDKRFSFWYDPWCGGNLWKNGRWSFPMPLDEGVSKSMEPHCQQF